MGGMSLNSGLTVSVGLSLGDGFSTGGGLTDVGFAGIANPAVLLLGNEYEGLAIDFTVNQYAVRTLNANDILGNEPRGLALEFLSNTYAVRTV
jgi:hypothetical protein